MIFSKLWENIVDFFFSNWNKLFVFLMVLILGYLLIRFLARSFRRLMNKSKMRGAAGDFLSSLVRVVLYVIYLVALLALSAVGVVTCRKKSY